MELDYFDLLPDEIVLKIIELVISSYDYIANSYSYRNLYVWRPRHDFLLDTIGNLSKRFKRISHDKTLWSDKIIISNKQNFDNIIEKFDVAKATDFQIHYDNDLTPHISRYQLKLLAEKCPKIKSLKHFFHLDNPCGPGILHHRWTNLDPYR